MRCAYVCGECGTVSVAFYAAPEPLTRFYMVGGVDVLLQSTPPPFDPTAPLRAAVRRGSPRRLPPRTPPCRGAQGKMSVSRRSPYFRAPALAGAEPRTRSRLKCSPFGRLRTKCLVRPCAVFDPRRKVAPMRAARSAATASHEAGVNKTTIIGCFGVSANGRLYAVSSPAFVRSCPFVSVRVRSWR